MKALQAMIWATLERGFPRLASALVMLFFARATDPHSVGIYSWIALVYTFYFGLAESALRNQMIMCLGNPESLARARTLSLRVGVAGSLALALAVVVLLVTYGSEHRAVVSGLAPFAAAPLITSSGIESTARMQYAHQWRSLARYQLVAAVAGLAVALTTLTTTRSSLAMSVHVLTTESAFLWFARRAATGTTVPYAPPVSDLGGQARHLAALGGLTWCQNQLERVLIGALAGAAPLGVYSTAAAMGRAPGEALALATVNYVRSSTASQRANPDEGGGRSDIYRRVGHLAVIGSTLLVVVVLVVVDLVLDPFLGSKWHAALHVTPIMALATVPYSLSSTLQVMAAFDRNARASLFPAFIGISMALPIGALAMNSVTLAASLMVTKELLILGASYGLSRPKGAAGPVVHASLVTAAFGLVFWLTWV